MNDRPTAAELLRAVEAFLLREAAPALDGPRRYHARVAANVVAIVAREIACEESQLRDEWGRLGRLLGETAPLPEEREALREAVAARSRVLCERIRRGEADAGPWRAAVLAHLRRSVADKLAVARPRRPRP